MSPKLLGPRAAGAFGNIQHHAIRCAPPLTGKPALFIGRQSSDQRLGHQCERARVLPSLEFLEMAHAQECDVGTANQHHIRASRCLFLPLEACRWRPLRRLRNFATFLVTVHRATIVYVQCTLRARLVSGGSRTRAGRREVVVGSCVEGKSGASTSFPFHRSPS